MKSIAT